MNTTRRKMMLGLAALPFSMGIGSAWGAEDGKETGSGLLGSWHVTSATNSVILSIEAGGEALVLLLKSGSFSIARAKWKALPGGVLVESIPRFRLWAGSDRLWANAEMDMPEGLDVSESWQEFPEAFFMRRVEDSQLPNAWRNQPLRSGWESATVDKEWDQKAGQRRQKLKPGVEPNAAPNAAPPRR